MATNNSLNLNSSNPLSLATGGTGASLTASNGGLLYSGASATAILAGTATANQIPLSGASGAPSWSTATYLSALTANGILYASGSNVMAQITTANSAVLITSSAGVPSLTSSLTNGQLIIGSTGASPVPATLTAGTGITITNAAGSITINATGAGFAWSNANSTPITAAANTGYIINNGSTQVVFTLPSAPPVGTTVLISGHSTGGWQILPGAGDSIQIGSINAATSVTNTNQFDSIELVYQGSGFATWNMQSSVGTFTIV